MMKNLLKTPKIWLTLDVCEELFEIFRKKIEFDEPIPAFDTRFPGRLESIINSVSQSYKGKYLNSTVIDAAVAYFNQLVRGHAFENGNKRIAVLFTDFFLWSNSIEFTLSWQEMYHFAVLVAQAGEKNISFEETKKLCREIIGEFTRDLPKG